MDLKKFLVKNEIDNKLKFASMFSNYSVEAITKDFVWIDRYCLISATSEVKAEATDYSAFALNNHSFIGSDKKMYCDYWLREDLKGSACIMNTAGKVNSKVDVSDKQIGIRPRINIRYEEVKREQLLSKSQLSNESYANEDLPKKKCKICNSSKFARCGK